MDLSGPFYIYRIHEEFFSFFKSQSEILEHVLPQASLLGIRFYCFHSTQLEGPD